MNSLNNGGFKKYGGPILSVAVIILGTMVFFSIIGFDLLPIQDKEIEKIVDIEAFDSMTSTSFCKSHEGNINKLQESCSKLTKDNCTSTSCCVYAKMQNKEQCHSGDSNGPTFRRDKNGKTHDIDYFFYRDKCFGNGCPIIDN
jgi:hypothetical protein